jgi:dolichol-phosphate mannosyltransferase
MNEMTQIRNHPKKWDIVIPIYDEEEIIEELHKRLCKVLSKYSFETEIIYTLDGCTDRTLEILIELKRAFPQKVKIVKLTRNFGLQSAVHAGLSLSTGEIVTIMDGDMQDPPELLPLLFDEWCTGTDIVITQKKTREDGYFRKVGFSLFYMLQKILCDFDLPMQAGNFCLLSHRVIKQICNMKEHNRYFPGLRIWPGFKTKIVSFNRPKRLKGKPKMSLIKLFFLACDGIFSFTKIPFMISWLFGTISCFVGIALILNVLIQKFITHTAIPGWTSTIIAITFIGGVQLLMIGILGEYIRRIFDEVRDRPQFVIDEIF